jgi:site-specific recombinase XerD
MTANAVHLQPDATHVESADFILDSEEVEKGRRAVAGYLASRKTGEARELAEEALHNLALLFTGGLCDAFEFPWQQVRAYHIAAALAMLKQAGAPARIETMRFERNSGWKYRVAPEAFSSREIQSLRVRLRRVLHMCHELGFLTSEELERVVTLPKARGKRSARGRALSDSEYRALVAVCGADSTAEGARDALTFCLAYRGGLQLNELAALSLEDLGYDAKRDRVTVHVRSGKKGRGRTIPLHNATLVALEDWLEWRGRDEGPLLCPVSKNGVAELRRLTASAMRQCCDTRAAEAGLEIFSVNDLARASRSPQLVSKSSASKTSSRQKSKAWSVGASVLYAGEPTAARGEAQRDERPAETVQFPHLSRIR